MSLSPPGAGFGERQASAGSLRTFSSLCRHLARPDEPRSARTSIFEAEPLMRGPQARPREETNMRASRDARAAFTSSTNGLSRPP